MTQRFHVIVWSALTVLLVSITVGLVAKSNFFEKKPSAVEETVQSSHTGDMQITSSAFADHASIPTKYTCDGGPPDGGISPPLAISGVPEGAQSLVLLVEDPDAPAGTWDHWVVFNIPPTTTTIPEGEAPVGVRGKGSDGTTGYAGPCPPDREHRYFFTLYALDTKLDLTEGVRKAEVQQAMDGHILEQAELVGRYNRI